MITASSPRILLWLLATLAVACDGAAGQPAGIETGPCKQGECFDGLVCLSELCVSEDAATSAATDGMGPGGGGESPGDAGDPMPGADTSTTGTPGDGADESTPDGTTVGTPGDTSVGAGEGTTTGSTVSETTGDETTSGASAETSTSDGAVVGTTDTGGAPAECGNGVLELGEQCDQGDLQGFTCESLGFGGGGLACDSVMCVFDTSMCTGVVGGTGG